jgi:dTDP-4-amino-4,6-dideoxygalactose transaminase
MIQLAVPELTGHEALYLQECITSTFVSSVGPFVDRFESMVAAASGSLAAVAVASGTTGLHAALTTIGVRRDDLVILPAFTFIASANAVAHCGALPWLFDVTPARWTLDPVQLEQALCRETEQRGTEVWHRASGRRVAAILPVHTLGLPADMEAIVDIARHHGLPVVADAAAALGAEDRGRPVGQLGADLTVFSFNGNKTITCGGGGAIAGMQPDLVALARHLTTTARHGDAYDHDRVGFNYRMTNLQAAVGCAQMERLEQFLAAKRRIHQRYNEALQDLPHWRIFPAPAGARSACWFAGGWLEGSDGSDPADPMPGLLQALRAAGVGARPFWKPMHWQAPYRECPRMPLPISEYIAPRILTLPCSTGLGETDQEYVIEVVRNLLKSSP